MFHCYGIILLSMLCCHLEVTIIALISCIFESGFSYQARGSEENVQPPLNGWIQKKIELPVAPDQEYNESFTPQTATPTIEISAKGIFVLNVL